MIAYAFQAALYCADCARAHMTGQEDTGDSDDFPQGPLADGGGEADTPQHCDACGLFLENPLTPDGRQYVREAVARYINSGGRDGDGYTIALWREFYLDAIGGLDDAER